MNAPANGCYPNKNGWNETQSSSWTGSNGNFSIVRADPNSAWMAFTQLRLKDSYLRDARSDSTPSPHFGVSSGLWMMLKLWGMN